jgi:pyrimidine-nucleoside phosphorylase
MSPHSAFLPTELIRTKRDGERLDDDQIRAFIAGVTDESIPDYQVAAMLMAVYLRGLDDGELAVWADAMLHSGEVIDLAAVERPKVDKHSTGGVGDKISLPLAPAVAACGVAVPMVSGRGLGHTGGTLDKLESIPGFRVDLDLDTFRRQVAELGVCLIGQTARLAPADRRLYALRDVTATVESIPLIASSIMSKKLAEGIDALVLDCKVGAGAFMKSHDRARQLATAIQAIGAAAGRPVTAVLTRMDAPIGAAVGNAVEVAESLAVLHGEGPADTRELTVALGAEMLVLGGVAADREAGAAAIERALDTGTALEVFRRLVAAQGGDPAVCDRPDEVLPRAPHHQVLEAPRAGHLAAIDALEVGMAALVLGAGRRRKDDRVDPGVGVLLRCRVGDRIEAGQPLADVLHAGRGLEPSLAYLREAFVIADQPAPAEPRVLEVLR